MAKRTGDEFERCPAVSAIQKMVGGKWKIELLYYIGKKDVRRFGQLRRCIGGISESTLSKQLRELQADGLIERIDYQEVPPRVEYRLGELGSSFMPILDAMKAWGEENLEKGKVRPPE